MLIGRKKEIEELLHLCDRKESVLAVVYGRRRVGKTYLIHEMFKQHAQECSFFSFTGSFRDDNQTELKNFHNELSEWFNYTPSSFFEDWTDAFNALKFAIKEVQKEDDSKKVVLFLDEIAWIDKTNKNGFLSALGYFWNTFCERNKNIVMILCGSNASWIKNKILKDSKGPFYQRVHKEILVEPFNLQETKEYLIENGHDIDDRYCTEIYMIFGGVAKYLSLLDERLSIEENVDKLFFTLNATLYGEYDSIFASLFYARDSYHKNIVDCICENGRAGITINELSKKTGVKNTDLTLRRSIEELIDTGFIKPMLKFQQSTRDIKYIIADPFILFYNKWVKPLSKNEIVNLNDYWQSQTLSNNTYPKWAGFSFEMVCIINIDLYLKARGSSSLFKNVSYWEHKGDDENSGVQIDFVVEYENNMFDVVECKYYNKEFIVDKNYAQNLQNKIELFKKYAIHSNKKYQIKLVMVSVEGTKRNSYYSALKISKDIKLKDMI